MAVSLRTVRVRWVDSNGSASDRHRARLLRALRSRHAQDPEISEGLDAIFAVEAESKGQAELAGRTLYLEAFMDAVGYGPGDVVAQALSDRERAEQGD